MHATVASAGPKVLTVPVLRDAETQAARGIESFNTPLRQRIARIIRWLDDLAFDGDAETVLVTALDAWPQSSDAWPLSSAGVPVDGDRLRPN